MRLFAALFLFALLGTPLARADGLSGLREPLKTVTEKYIFIEEKLAADSFDGVAAAAQEMKKAVADDQTHVFGPKFAPAVDQMAAATDLHAARVALDPLSSVLIATLAQNHVQTGALHSAYCPMVKAYWLQTDGQTIHNPYMGAAMSDCGAFEKQF